MFSFGLLFTQSAKLVPEVVAQYRARSLERSWLDTARSTTWPYVADRERRVEVRAMDGREDEGAWAVETENGRTSAASPGSVERTPWAR